jgi:uncharacterized protein DUF4154
MMQGNATGYPGPASWRCTRGSAGLLVLLALLSALLASSLTAQPPQPDQATSREYTIKATYLYHFLHYMTWPRTTRAPGDTYVIGVVHCPVLFQKLTKVAEKSVKGRRILVRKFKGTADARPCHILFVGRDQKKHLDAWRGIAERDHTLLVGDTPGFEKHGAVVNFFVKGNKVRLQINLEAAKRAGIKISSKLLKLAKIIQKLEVKVKKPPPDPEKNKKKLPASAPAAPGSPPKGGK